MNELKEIGLELLDACKTALACTICAIGCIIGLPGLILTQIGDGLIAASVWIHDAGKRGKFEKDDIEEDGIIYV